MITYGRKASRRRQLQPVSDESSRQGRDGSLEKTTPPRKRQKIAPVLPTPTADYPTTRQLQETREGFRISFCTIILTVPIFLGVCAPAKVALSTATAEGSIPPSHQTFDRGTSTAAKARSPRDISLNANSIFDSTRFPVQSQRNQKRTLNESTTHKTTHVLIEPTKLDPHLSRRTASPTHTPEAEDDEQLTPRKGAKAHSTLFDFSQHLRQYSEADSPPSFSGIAKRMLSRSHTEPLKSNLPTSPKSSLRKHASFQVPTSNGQLLADTDDSFLHNIGNPFAQEGSPSPSKHPSGKNTLKRTYAGESRSFLVAVPSSRPDTYHDDPLGDAQDEAAGLRDSYADLRSRWGVDTSEDNPSTFSPNPSPIKGKEKEKEVLPMSNNMANDLKSITELRSKGENRRFLDELGYLFEGLDPNNSVAIRRSSALELVSKMCDMNFFRKAKTTDFFSRSWNVLRVAGAGDGDKVLDAVIVFFAALTAREPSSLSDLARKFDLVQCLFVVLANDRQQDVLGVLYYRATSAEHKKFGVSRAEKASLLRLIQVVAEILGIFSISVPISTRLLISHTLVTLPPILISSPYMTTLRQCLESEISLIPSRIHAYLSGLPLIPVPLNAAYSDIPSILHLGNCLRLVDSFLLGHWTEETSIPLFVDDEDSRMSAGLVKLCVAVDILSRDNTNHADQTMNECLDVTLRVLISLSHENPDWCSALLKSELTLPLIMRVILRCRKRQDLSPEKTQPESHEVVDDKGISEFDRICLALGLLTNLVQAVEATKDILRETRIDPACSGKRECLRDCQCMNCISCLECLTLLYRRSSISEDTGAIFIRSHLAVLFGLLMKHSSINQSLLVKALPGSTDAEKLSTLIEQARDFAAFYAKLEDHLTATKNTDDDQAVDESTQLCEVDRRIHGQDRKNVTEDIVRYLQQLHDQHYR